MTTFFGRPRSFIKSGLIIRPEVRVQNSQVSQLINFRKCCANISWKNESPLPPDQGGNYKLYTQILLPPNSKVSQITKNNVLVEEVDTLSGQYNILGLYLEVNPPTDHGARHHIFNASDA